MICMLSQKENKILNVIWGSKNAKTFWKSFETYREGAGYSDTEITKAVPYRGPNKVAKYKT